MFLFEKLIASSARIISIKISEFNNCNNDSNSFGLVNQATAIFILFVVFLIFESNVLSISEKKAIVILKVVVLNLKAD